MKMIPRKEWGAEAINAYGYAVDPSKRTGVLIHHSVTAEGKSQNDVEATLRMIDKLHRSKGYGGIGYNIAVDFAGTVYEARGVNIMGSHAANANTVNYGIVYIGDGRTRITEAARTAIKEVIEFLQLNSKKKLTVRGHRDVNSTACPGDKIYALIQSGEFAVPYVKPAPKPAAETPETPAAPAPKPAAKPAAKAVTYTVKEGDTLSEIADKYKTTVAALVAKNKIKDANLIVIGQKLTIPGKAAPKPPVVYVVKAGDHLGAIAKRFGVTVQAIAKANNLRDVNFIRVGQHLTIPNK